MPELPVVSGREAVRALERLGFVVVRQRGSHIVMRKSVAVGNIGCVVPQHRELAVGTLRSILRQAQVAPEDFIANL